MHKKFSIDVEVFDGGNIYVHGYTYKLKDGGLETTIRAQIMKANEIQQFLNTLEREYDERHGINNNNNEWWATDLPVVPEVATLHTYNNWWA